ncbi:Antibiotic efflux pump membrane transporter ArpB [Cupriavidus campinensis]|uniref:Efflux pump membrane transporter n=1 Tax=Cupriavidus campinensis TaxID=151783 RepID=A0AAE9L4I8_9BURK|nr:MULTISPECIES: efflux RND transporter permease subunit [Cupriavidus]TSP12214.1 efflux RND transporter permease subunit [Cupriavidus campinensis]URF06135.1 efflux RND transporter permease subunit [Cupriavidus campinensis]CAG2129110.1 Antibiotic efflux pump membrane transporter ArpB [Cupriavidus campinensis]
MAGFFIDRPVFAWVVAILISLFGAIAMRSMGIDSYPEIAPPQVTVTANYPGASAATMESTVTQVIEQQLTGIDNLLYFSSKSSANGQTVITLTFATGTNPDIAQVQVQNKVTLATPLLPAQVTQQGVVVAKASPDILMFIALRSNSPAVDAPRLSDILASQIQPVIGRISGVGNTTLLGSEYAARIWIDPDKLQGYGLSTTQVLNAVNSQNAQFAAGSLGADPAVKGQVFTATVSGDSLFSSLQQFRDIILLSRSDGTTVRLSDVARVSFGAQTYGIAPVYDGKPAGGMAVFLLPGANALSVANAVKAQMASLARDLPAGVTWSVPYDTTPFITASITDVVHTLIEAIALVFIVMLVFLQNLRATIIPTLVIPVALLGTFIGLSLLHYTLNQLTLFGMVLAIGIVVDDAIVVIENVERIMSEEGTEPKAATHKAMRQITGAIIAITVVLSAVFVPSALQPGATGIIYAQFALTIAVSMIFSAFLAMSFTPSLCAAILRPVHPDNKGLVFRWFDRGFGWMSRTYIGHVSRAVRHAPRWMMGFVLFVVLAGFLYTKLPTGFVPDEDQGFILVLVNLPSGSTLASTRRVMGEVRDKLLHSPIGKDINAMFQPVGFSFVGTSENVGMTFIKLTDWSQRSQSAMALIPQVNQILHGVTEAQIFATDLPTIRGLSQFGGIDMYLQARSGQSRDQLEAAEKTLLEEAGKSPDLYGIRANSLPSAQQLHIAVDRTQAESMGLSLTDVYNTIQMELAPFFVNQFTYGGRVKRVYIQADAPFRMGIDAFRHLFTPAPNAAGTTNAGSPATAATHAPVNPSAANTLVSPYNIVPLSSVVSTNWAVAPTVQPRYDGYSAIEIVGNPASGYSTGQAMQVLQNIIDQKLPPGFSADWTGQSYQELLAGSSATTLMALSIVVVFLCLAALYESWSIPASVLLVAPIGMLGMLVFCLWQNVPNDIYFKIGLVTVIGLAAKNAILIVEFAVEGQARGLSLYDAVVAAARLRLRPILMTSMAFILGVFPLVVSTGAGAASRHELGIGVIGGMLAATVLGLLLIPVFYVSVRRVLGDKLDTPAGTREDA